MRAIPRLFACGVLAVALVAGPGAAQASAGGPGKAAKAQRAKASRAAKRADVLRFTLREVARALGTTPRALRQELVGHSLAQVIEAHGRTVSDVQAAVVAAYETRLDARVAAGKITQARADQLLARFQTRLSRLMTRVFNARPGAGPVRLAARGIALRAAAEFLGLTPRQLRQQLPGHSLAELAQAQGKSVTELQAAIVNAVKAKLDRLVARGRISQARADALLSRFQARVGELVAKVWPARNGG